MDRVVLVVRSDIEDDVRAHVERQHPDLEVAYVCQDESGPARAKPWGTGHAVMVAGPAVSGPFCVINADDYYGVSTFAALADAASTMGPQRALLAGFALGQTLPEAGTVSRGICGVSGSELVSLVETHGIARQSDGTITASDPSGVLDSDAVASMNCWVFPQSLFGYLEAAFEDFVDAHGVDGTDEFQLPSVINDLREAGTYTVGVVPTAEPWVGVTNPEDLEIARRRISEVRS